MKDTMIGVDLAKRVFQLHGASMAGHVKFRKKLTREQFRRFMSDQPSCVVVFEACGSASYWAREMEKFGHEARLIAAQYVKPFVKRQKNDAADAEAIVIAAQRPEMRFVSPKTEGQQARAVLLRSRERLVHQRTELVNALRAILYEYGHRVRLIAPHYVKPFIKRQKNDATDAEAATRPTMRFVEPKTEAQQARAVAFRAHEQIMKQRTEAINALRAPL